jgi:hypothetical protein
MREGKKEKQKMSHEQKANTRTKTKSNSYLRFEKIKERVRLFLVAFHGGKPLVHFNAASNAGNQRSQRLVAVSSSRTNLWPLLLRPVPLAAPPHRLVRGPVQRIGRGPRQARLLVRHILQRWVRRSLDLQPPCACRLLPDFLLQQPLFLAQFFVRDLCAKHRVLAVAQGLVRVVVHR